MKKRHLLSALALALLTFGLPASSSAAAVRDAASFTDSTLGRNDDGSTGAVGVGFTLNFFGTNFSQLYVNNNGNVTFDFPLGTYTPFGLTTNSYPIIAPFFADWDTRPTTLANGQPHGIVQYGTEVLNGHNTFGVNWLNIGYYGNNTDKLNSAQLILTERADTGAGNFDIEFNYDQIQWETGDASGGSGGLGGVSAAAGYTDGGANDFEFAGSRVNGAFLDSNPGGLIHGSRNSNVLGRYIFEVRNGIVQPPVTVPEPGSLALIAGALVGLGVFARRR